MLADEPDVLAEGGHGMTMPEQAFTNAGITPRGEIAQPTLAGYVPDTWDLTDAQQTLIELNKCPATAAPTRSEPDDWLDTCCGTPTYGSA